MAAIGLSSIHAPTEETVLPHGACNFRDLASGQHAPSCGCRRFWSNTVPSIDRSHEDGGRAWCFCGHHACYHDNGPSTINVKAVSAVERGLGTGARASSISTTQADAVGLGLPNIRADAGFWATLNTWARQQTDTAPDSWDTATSSPALRTKASMHSVELDKPVETASATDIDTTTLLAAPDRRGRSAASQELTQDLSVKRSAHSYPMTGSSIRRQAQDQVVTTAISPGAAPKMQITSNDAAQRAPISELLVADSLVHSRLATPSLIELHNLVQSCAQRIDVLETLSFSHVPVEDIEDELRQVDDRLQDLETWRDECDTAHDEVAVQPDIERQRQPSPFASLCSFSSDLASRSRRPVQTAATNASYGGRLEDIEQRLGFLEDRLPSFAHPWQIEVVLLPWGRDLHGIWSPTDPESSILHSVERQGRSEWKGNGAPLADTLDGEHHNAISGWTSDSIEAWNSDTQQWYCPKACGPRGTVYKRLKSLGLVQNVSLTTQDANSMLTACMRAFQSFLDVGIDRDLRGAITFHALNEPLIPLRKVRKPARLQFLANSEMVTSAVWTAGFLDSGVFMRVSGNRRRLYLTTSDAYTQTSTGWTWHMLRNALEDTMPSNTSIADCWAHDPIFDLPAHTFNPFAPDPNIVTQRNDVTEEAATINDWDTRATSPASATAATHEDHSASPHVVSGSTCFKRRGPSDEIAAPREKRSRKSEPCEVDQCGQFTPRLSREPPSPWETEERDGVWSEAASIATRRRGGTPFAYATPHSNTATNAMLHGGDGDTEADTEIIWSSDRGEDEWAGALNDENHMSSPISDTGMALAQLDSIPESNGYEDDLDTGLTIYEE